MAAGQTWCAVVMQRSFGQPESFERDVNNRRKSSTAYALTVTTMALEHGDRFSTALVSDRAASATSCERDIHMAVFVSEGLFGVINSIRFSNSASKAA